MLELDLYGTKFPAKWEICHRCEGNGTHGNPAFDGMSVSITPDNDEEFWDNLRQGFYDVQCNECNGTGKLKVIDEARATPEQIADYADWERSKYEMEQEERMEMRAMYGPEYMW